MRKLPQAELQELQAPGAGVMSSRIRRLSQELCDEIAGLPLEEAVDALNLIRRDLHAVSPFRSEPVDLVEWVPADSVRGNTYNPNRVAPPELELLELSIQADGYTQPIVKNQEGEEHVVVDGFHRSRVGKESPKIKERIHGYLPVVQVRPESSTIAARQQATIRHNRARGEHATELMGRLVRTLSLSGMSDEEIATGLGMQGEEVLRLRQLSKAAKVLSSNVYNRAWELVAE